MKNNKGQEEMVGFALIIIIVAIILLVFLAFSLNAPQKEAVESYEVESFINVFLQYTTDCAETYEPNYLSVQKLINSCNRGETCSDNRLSCEVLESTLTDIIEESWKTGEESPVKGYELKILSNSQDMLVIRDGNQTSSYKGSFVQLSGAGSPEIYFTAYY